MDKNDPNWRAAFYDELARWKAKSYADLRAAFSGDSNISYERDGADGYQVEVELLENQPDYLHVMVSVCAPRHGLVCRPICESFIRHADGPGSRSPS